MKTRERFSEIVNRAARAGVSHPERLFHQTPKEMEWTFASFSAQKRRELELADIAAWLTGRYVALALLAPNRYPERPNGVLTADAESAMTDLEIQQAFQSIFGKGEEP